MTTNNKITLIPHKKAPTFRNQFERGLGDALKHGGYPYKFEPVWIHYTQPEKARKYKPDFILANGIIIEAKGRLESDDRKKMVLVKAQYPELDIRFVFQYARGKLYKGSKTTYAKWAVRNGFPWADKKIPVDWINEPRNARGIVI